MQEDFVVCRELHITRSVPSDPLPLFSPTKRWTYG